MSTEQEKIKELVKERYGARAERVINLTPAELDSDGCGCSTGGACCGVEDLDHAMLLYNEGQLAGLPTESIAAARYTATASTRPSKKRVRAAANPRRLWSTQR